MFVEALIKSGENAISIPPAAICITENDKIVQWGIKPIELGLQSNLLPVPYGDVVLDFAKGCTIISTEVILDYLARQLGATRVIIAGKVDGVFTADPISNPSAKFIPEITSKNIDEVRGFLAGSDGVDVTGGMLHKVEKMLELSKHGIESEIINADKPGILKRALMGERGLGTIIR